MRTRHLGIIGAVIISLIVACGSEKPAGPKATVDYLLSSYDAIGVARTAPPRLFKGQDLWEYIDGGAELYLKYGFKEVATADYRKGETEMVVELYRFDSDLNAFGLYSMMRPDSAHLARYGVEGFVAPGQIEFVKGDLVVRVTGYDASDESNLALINLADEIEKQLPGATQPPAAFKLFPASYAVAGSEKYYAVDFLGLSFLTDVYSQDFQPDSTRVTLFLCELEAGPKLLDWSRAAEQIGSFRDMQEDLVYDEGKAFEVDSPYYGLIVVGMRGNRMVGAVGYTDSLHSFMYDWLNDLE